jgi:hypothetical protein
MFSLSGERYYVKDFHQRWLLFAISSDSVIPYSTDGSLWGLMDLSVDGYTTECQFDCVWYTPGNKYAFTFLGEVNEVTGYEPGMEYVMMYEQGKKGMIRASDGKEILTCENVYCEEQYGYIVFMDAFDQLGVIDLAGNAMPGLAFTILHQLIAGNTAFLKIPIQTIQALGLSVSMEKC